MLSRLRRRVGGADDALLREYLRAAEEAILAFTRRRELIPELENAAVDLAAALWARRGMEGESSHGEGSLRCEMEDFPELIRAQIAPYRLARTMR